MVLPLTYEELWWVQNLVRQADRQGAPWDRDDMAEVHRGLLRLHGQPAAATWPIPASIGFLWQIENQVPQSLDLGRSNLGRSILMKVFRALHEEGGSYEDIPAVFRDADAYEDVPVSDSDPGTAAKSRGDLS